MDSISIVKELLVKNKDLLEALAYIVGILAVLIPTIIAILKFIRKKSALNFKSIKTYKECIKKENSHLDAEKLFGEQAFPLSLPEIFIPLYANDPEIKQKHEREMAEKQKPVDIEELIGKYDRLVIEGHAGSGKTTVLKHVAYSLVIDDNYAKSRNMKDFIPVLIYLKYLNEYFEKGDPCAKSGDILKWYLINKVENCLEYEVLEDLIKAGRVLFLLDGLDELKHAYRDPLINTFIHLQTNNSKNKLVFSGRPHGITGNLINKFENRHIKVNDLNDDQINEFIRKWFKYLYKEETASVKKSAESLISDIKSNEATGQLKSNPLMLTAICILYHDDKELPAQRAELYKKFIDNMLYRRFGNNFKKVLEYLEILAFGMHEKGIRTIGREYAIEMLIPVFPKEKPEKDKDFKDKIKEKFEDIEPKCGLIKFENGEYSFWHLSFQEYLCAAYIADNSNDLVHGVAKYWGNRWYKEVIELYIGYLSMNSKTTANDIVRNALNEDSGKECNKWLVAANALYDIHKDRRLSDVEKLTREKLQQVFEKESNPQILAEAGEVLGWLGDLRDLKEFVTIPGADYDLGELGNAKIISFEISKYLVSNKWFGEFIEAGGYKKEEFWSIEGKKWLKYTKYEFPRFWHDRVWKCPNKPVVGVCWWEADAFCRWLSINDKKYKYRLPTEQEWQAVATGKEKREYPWGNDWVDNFCNYEGAKIGKTSAAGVFLKGATPEKVFDMAGNVWEWIGSDYNTKDSKKDFPFDEEVQELYKKEKYQEAWDTYRNKGYPLPSLRGGSWISVSDYCRCANRDYYRPDSRGSDVGFRCARIKF